MHVADPLLRSGMDMYTINFIGHEFIKLGEITVPDVQQLLFQGSAAILYNTIGYLCLVDVNTGTSAPVPTVRLHRLPVIFFLTSPALSQSNIIHSS